MIAASFAAMAAFIAWRLINPRFVLPSSSMAPTIQQGEVIRVRRVWDPCGNPPARGTVVMHYAPFDEKTRYIKRIVALGGETVELRGKILLIDGEPVDDPHAFYVGDANVHAFPQATVPPGHFFVMGDNRNRSSDSRIWGTLPCELVKGIWEPPE